MKTSLYLLALIMLLAAPAHAEVTYTLDEDYGNVPVTFVPNVGQFDEGIVFAAEGNNGGVFNDDEGLIFELAPETVKLWPPDAAYDYKTYLQFRDANANPEVTFEDQAPWNNNYFIGNDKSQWHTDVPNYRTVRFSEIYPGVDLCMTGNGRVIVSSIIVEPHGDPSQIYFPGGGSRTVDEDGNLCVEFYRDPEIASSRYYVYEPPECLQYIDGEEKVVALTYKVIDVPDDYTDIVTFDIGEYDPAHELIIKPGPVYSPLMLVKDSDQYRTEVADLEVDEEGCAYVAGKGGYIFPSSGDPDMNALFALKLNEAGDELGYVTYYSDLQHYATINAIDIDSQNHLYLAGFAGNGDFPITDNAFDQINAEHGKAYVMKMSHNGNKIEYSSLLGGTNASSKKELGDIVVDNYGCLYVCGWTISKDFPTTPNVFKEDFTDNKTNGYVTKFNSDGSNIIFSTFFDTAMLNSIQVDNAGEICVSGYDGDAFVGKLNADASDTLFTVRFRGNLTDVAAGIDIDNDGNIYVVGSTESEDFHTTDGSENHGEFDCFVTKINNNGFVEWSTLIGGSGDDAAGNIRVDKDCNTYITGYTHSSEYPVTSNGMRGYGSIITIVNPWGEELIYSSVLGNTQGAGLSLNKNNDVFIFGYGGKDLPTNSIISEGYGYLVKIDKSGETLISEETHRYDEFIVNPAYPNPFNPLVTLSYHLPQSGNVLVKIYNLQGQVVDELVNEHQSSGYHTVTWDAEQFASGVYLYQIETKNKNKTGKLLRMK